MRDLRQLFYENRWKNLFFLFLLISFFLAGFFAVFFSGKKIVWLFLPIVLLIDLLLILFVQKKAFRVIFCLSLCIRPLLFGLCWRAVFRASGLLLRIVLGPVFAFSFLCMLAASLLLYGDLCERKCLTNRKIYLYLLAMYVTAVFAALL